MRSLYLSKAELFTLLSDPLAIRLLDLICNRDYELSSLLAKVDPEEVPEAPTVLSRLRHAGLVELRRTGREVVVTLSAPSVANVLSAARFVMHECREHEEQPRIIDLERQPTALPAQV